MRENSPVARLLQALLKYSLRCSDRVIALDRFMRERIIAKGIQAERISVLPPWSHDEEIRYDEVGRARFAMTHGLTQKFVVMYSGNHSACHPLDTLLTAALTLRSDERIVFCFVGGGSEFQQGQRLRSESILYQTSFACLTSRAANLPARFRRRISTW